MSGVITDNADLVLFAGVCSVVVASPVCWRDLLSTDNTTFQLNASQIYYYYYYYAAFDAPHVAQEIKSLMWGSGDEL